MEAGLGSLPGGGAEIFAERVRQKICKDKANAEQWLEVHRTAHRLGLRSNCTMLYGTIETLEERVDHMLQLRALQAETGDRLEFAVDGRGDCPAFVVSPRMLPFFSPFPTIRVIPGPEFGLLDERSNELLFESDFEVTRRSDRMGYRLSGPELSLREPHEMVSSAVSFGTIQLLPDGQLIVLMADHQTTGGYPRVAQIISTDLPLAAQIQATGKIALHEVSPDHAESLFLNSNMI